MRTGAARRTCALVGAALLLSGGGGVGCAYFNTLYNAKAKFAEAQVIKDRAELDREKITKQEEKLYADAFDGAANVVRNWPDSKWVDDALLLMGQASHEKGDYSTALRKFDEILTIFSESELRAEALVNKGRTHIAAREYPQALEALGAARELDEEKWRADVIHLLGVVRHETDEHAEALVAFTEVVERHRGSLWLADAGMRAGEIALEDGDAELAVSFFERVRADGRTPEERFRGGMAKGEALVDLGEWKRAETTYGDVVSRSTDEEDQSNAELRRGEAVKASGDVDRAVEIWLEILERYPRREGAAGAQFAFAALADEAGDFEVAREQYDLIREQGTGHEIWQDASARMAEIDRVLELREKIESGEEPEPERDRYLLAEQLLERIGDTDGALAEYESLAADASGTEWGAKALYAQAWVLENRLDEADSADVLMHRLANYYSGTEVDASARRRFGYPVWTIEIIDPGRVIYVRPEGAEEGPQEIVRELVTPEPVALPEGTNRAQVWARIHIAEDGSAERVKIVKSVSEEIDAAVKAAAEASSFLPPDEGGPSITVIEYRFPPDDVAPGEDDVEPSADDRDAALEAIGGGLPPGVSMPPSPADADSMGDGSVRALRAVADSLKAVADSVAAADRSQPRKLRDRDFDPTTAD